MPQTLDSITPGGIQPAMDPHDARWSAVRVAPSLTLAAGTVLGKKTADGLMYAYVTGAADGTDVAAGILKHDIKTDANGRVFLISGSTAAVETETIKSQQTAVMYYAGTFDPADVLLEDAAALTDWGARTLWNGFIRLP